MASALTVPTPDLWLLASGRSIVAFSPRHAVGLNDEVELTAGPARIGSELQPGFTAVEDPAAEDLSALVIAVQPASSLNVEAESNFLAQVPEGDVLILRVYQGNEPVVEEVEFQDRRAGVEAEFR